MRTLTPYMAAQIARTNGAGFRPFVVITPPGGTPRTLSTASLTLNGTPIEAQLLTTGSLDESLTRLADLSIELPDTPQNRTDVQLLAQVEIQWWPIGGAMSDADTLFVGLLSDPIVRGNGKIRFDLIARAYFHHQGITRPVGITDYPQATPSIIGQSKPVIYGAITQAPCLPIDVGSLTTLATDLTELSSSITVTDNSYFPTAGTVRIDNEEIGFTSKSGAIQLSGCTRGINGTTAAPHKRGAKLAEIQPLYHYLIADHAIKSGTDIRYEDVGMEGAEYTLNLPQGKITMDSLLTLGKMVSLIVEEDIDVVSSQDAHGHGWSGSTTTDSITQYITTPFVSVTSGHPYYSIFENIPGSYVSGNVTVTVTGNDWEISPFFPGAFPGPPINGVGFRTLSFGGSGFIMKSTNGATVNSAYRDITYSNEPSIAQTQPNVDSIKIGTVSLQGNQVVDTTIGGKVTLDVEGWADDPTGSITGTPYALIERPDHVVRHILRHYGNATNAETSASDFDPFTNEKLAIYLDQPIWVRDLLAQIATQCRAIITYSAGRWIMRRRPTVGALKVATITPNEIIRNEDGTSTLTESRSGLTTMANRHVWRAGLNPDRTWQMTGTQNNTPSQTLYGVRDTTIDLPFIQDATQAQSVIDWLSARQGNPNRAIITCSTTLSHSALELGDVVRIEHPNMGVDCTGEIVAINRPLTGRGFGLITLTVEAL